MYQRILVALDQSPLAEQVLPFVRLLASRLRATAVLFHVVEPAAPPGAEGDAKAYLRTIAQTFNAPSTTVEAVVVRGVPATTIATHAVHDHADLIALCTHGRGGMQRWVHGSVTEKILQGTHLPLLIVRAQQTPVPAPEGLRRVLLTLDRSELAEAAVPHAVAIAKAFDAELLLYHVWEGSGYIFDASHDPQVEQVMRDTYAYSQQYLEDMTRRLMAQGVRAQWIAESGNVADHILRAADSWQADLLIMSTHGRSGMGRWALGSVADRVLRHGQKPVLLVRSG